METILIAAALAVGALAGALAGIRWARRRRPDSSAVDREELLASLERHEVAAAAEQARRDLERDLAARIAEAETEPQVLDAVREVLVRHQPDRLVEIHLVHPAHPVLELAVSTAPGPLATATASPWDARAAREGRTEVYESTASPDTCPHLRSRVEVPCSAVAAPLTIMGRILGVLYATGPEGTRPDPDTVGVLEHVAWATAAHVAVVRSFALLAGETGSGSPGGIAEQAEALEAVRNAVERGAPCAVALARPDPLRPMAGGAGGVDPEAVGLLAEVTAASIRPGDLVARDEGDRLLVVVSEATAGQAAAACERIREELVMHHAARGTPGFTVSFGVADADGDADPGDLVAQAEAALVRAQEAGGNRVVAADPGWAGLHRPGG